MRTEYGWPTGSSVYLNATGSALRPDWEEQSIPYGGWPGPAPGTWQCNYCGTSHWVEDRELQCGKCGGPRDV